MAVKMLTDIMAASIVHSGSIGRSHIKFKMFYTVKILKVAYSCYVTITDITSVM